MHHLRELRIGMEDRAGSLARLTEGIGKAGVNIESIAAIPSAGRGDIRLLVADTAAARKALAAAGINVEGERDVLMVELDDVPGALGQMARKLGDANVNVDAIYIVGGADGKKVIALGVSDIAKGRAALA